MGRATAIPRTGAWLSTSLAARSRDDLDNVRLAFEASLAATTDRRRRRRARDQHAVAQRGLLRRGPPLGRRPPRGDLDDTDRLWALLLSADVGWGRAIPGRCARPPPGRRRRPVDDPGAAVVVPIYEAIVHLDDPARATRRLEAAARRAREIGEPGLARLARGYRLVTVRMQGPSEALVDEARDLVETRRARLRPLHLPLGGQPARPRGS